MTLPYWATHRFWLDSFTDVTHAVCDPKWRTQSERWMLDFIRAAEERWGDRIGAYILSGGGTSEWYEYDRGRTSEKKDAAWVAWCRARGVDYGPTVPSRPSLAKAAFENLVYDPETEPEKIAYWQFHNSLPAEALLSFAKAARAGVHRYVEDCTPVFTKANFVAVHTAKGGRRTIRLPRRAARVIDMLSDETVATETDAFDAYFATPDTRLFKIENTP